MDVRTIRVCRPPFTQQSDWNHRQDEWESGHAVEVEESQDEIFQIILSPFFLADLADDQMFTARDVDHFLASVRTPFIYEFQSEKLRKWAQSERLWYND
ncbi:MAG: hypothetical protein AAB837_00485 [Patescibacteria group bacterium]